MNTLDYINSRDIRDYLKKIDYQFSPLETAYLIYQSKKTIAEKHAAWKELMETTADAFFDESGEGEFASRRFHHLKGHTFHEVIKAYMDRQNKLLDLIKSTGDGPAFYTVEYWCSFWDAGAEKYSHDEWFARLGGGGKCSSYELCLSGIKRNAEDDDQSFKITKTYVMDEKTNQTFGKYLWVVINKEFEPIEVNSSGFDYEEDSIGGDEDFFGKNWFRIPVPFQKGDLVTECVQYADDEERVPLVLNDMFYWYGDRMQEEYPERKHRYEGTDVYDMVATCYQIGVPSNPCAIRDDCLAPYLNLEFYRGETTGNEKILKLLSACIKGEINPADAMMGYGIVVDQYRARCSESALDSYWDEAPVNKIIREEDEFYGK